MNKQNKLTGTSLVGDTMNRERVDNDYYATPTDATASLLESFDLSMCKTFLEPACGEGHISKVLERWFGVGTFNSKIYSFDLINRGFGYGKTDFLKFPEVNNWLFRGESKVDCIITNPPFKLAQEFIEKALRLSNKYVIMFAKIQLLEGVERKKLFDKFPPKYIYVFTNRVNPLRNGNPLDENGKKWASTMCFAWFIWEIGFEGEPTIRWLNSNKLITKSD